jgi:ribosome recycling factor
LTEERRREMVKKAKLAGEESRVGVRNARRDAIEEIRKGIKNGLSEDLGKKKEEDMQQLTNKYTEKIEKIVEFKEKDIMTV